MKFNELKKPSNLSEVSKTYIAFLEFKELLTQLSTKEITQTMIDSINMDIEDINSSSLDEKLLMKLIKKKQSEIIKWVEKELKIVPKNYYRNLWLALGMSVFGLPLGIAIGTSLKNMGLMAIGLPIGMVIGVAIGTKMDQKALAEGRQLDIELK